jgi:hypothetical protein
VCPHCAEELPDQATVCSVCHKDPALAPGWAAPSPSEAGASRLGNVWGPTGILPTSERVPAPFKPSETAKARAVPPNVWASLILAWCWGLAPIPSGVAGLVLMAAGYVVGLILAIWGEVQASDRRGRILATLAIIINGINLAGTFHGMPPWYRLGNLWG